MISLIGEDFTVKITEDNPAYNTLKKFSGETVLIYDTPEIKVNKKAATQRQSYESVKINNEDIFRELYVAYPQLDGDSDEEIPVWMKLLENHVFQILGSKTGFTELEKIAENKFKKGELYLLVPSHFNK
jgi:hypothetical protein